MNTPANSGSNELKYGAGQLNPAKARYPGLVYDVSERDYIAMLCAQGYNATALALITGSAAPACADSSVAGSTVGELNYPTMAAQVEPGQNFTVGFPRTATNVGDDGGAVYDVKVVFAVGAAADLIAVAISPSRLEFSERNAKFTVTVAGVAPGVGRVVSAAVVWSDGEHRSGALWWCTHTPDVVGNYSGLSRCSILFTIILPLLRN